MPTILYSPTSPYSAKVRMAAHLAGIEFESVHADASSDPAILLDANPLGKIPVFIPDEGEAVYDSRAITQYLNRVSKNALFPRNADKRTEAELLEAQADGLLDCLLAHVMERRSHAPEKVEQSWLDRQWARDGIRVNSIAPHALSPGLRWWTETNPEEAAEFIAAIPMKRIGDPEADIGRAVVALVGPDLAYLTGATVPLDGGQAHF